MYVSMEYPMKPTVMVTGSSIWGKYRLATWTAICQAMADSN